MIIGYQKILEFLKNSAQSDKLPHAFLFSGQEKLGKKKLAFEFVKWLFQCPTNYEFNRITNKNIEALSHPDLIFVAPIKKEIQISQIRESIWKLALKPSLAPYKVAIIDQAHCLNQEAQNCLLKTLEEPKGKVILFLITEYPEALFPTIRSRCQIIQFFPVKKEEDLQELEITKQKENELKKILNSDLTLRFQYVKTISQNQDLNEILKSWLSYFRKILLSKLKEKQKISISDIARLKQIQKTIFLLSTTNVNPRLALEILMMEL